MNARPFDWHLRSSIKHNNNQQLSFLITSLSLVHLLVISFNKGFTPTFSIDPHITRAQLLRLLDLSASLSLLCENANSDNNVGMITGKCR